MMPKPVAKPPNVIFRCSPSACCRIPTTTWKSKPQRKTGTVKRLGILLVRTSQTTATAVNANIAMKGTHNATRSAMKEFLAPVVVRKKGDYEHQHVQAIQRYPNAPRSPIQSTLIDWSVKSKPRPSFGAAQEKKNPRQGEHPSRVTGF